MIAVEKLAIRAGAFALNDVSFQVRTGEWCVLMGRTGCGKTSLLEAMCGLRTPTSGSITLHGQDVTRASPGTRRIGYVPQDKALFNTMTVRENLAFALRLRSWSSGDIESRVGALAELLGIGALLDRLPHRLSGGEAQRVALGRALAARPPVLCLDEPLSALDDETREEMHAVLRKVREHTQATTLHVTHHLSDARHLADRVLVLRDGRVTESSVAEIAARRVD